MPIYNKLIRDKIPAIMDRSGKSYAVRTLEDGEYVHELRTKLGEELQEYLSAANDTDALEELADLQELILTLSAIHGATPDQLEAIRMKKAEERGGFRDKLFLVEVYE